MWGKSEQIIIWLIAYIPVFLIAIYRFAVESKISNFSILKYELSVDLIHFLMIFLIMGISIALYTLFPKIIFKKLENNIDTNRKGQNYIVKNYERPNINDYTFFLLTLILPLITVDFSSTVSFLVCMSVIILIIILLVNINYIIACPLFFVSRYKVWKVKLIEKGGSELSHSFETYVITKEDDFLNKDYKAVKLLRNLYFMKLVE